MHVRSLLYFLLVGLISLCAQIFALSLESQLKSLASIAFNACRSIVDESKQELFYIYEDVSDSKPSFGHLNQRLHEASIKTILISHHSQLINAVNTYHGKNIIFLLEDVRELMSLIFYTISHPGLLNVNSENTKSLKYDKVRKEHKSKGILPPYCITVDGRSLWRQGGKTCSGELKLSSAALEPNSILSDRVFNATRGLYVNKIWNSKNYLVFILRNFDLSDKNPGSTALVKKGNEMQKDAVDTDPVASLVFCFKFFWRFFRGLRSVICHLQGCEKYNPFAETLIFSGDENGENFYDFSWSNMHKKSITTFLPDDTTQHLFTVLGSPRTNWIALCDAIFDDFERSVNCTLKNYRAGFEFIEDAFRRFGPEMGLKFDIDMRHFEYGLSLEGFNVSQHDFSVSVDMRSLCFATPHSSFMPQGLVIFKTFSPLVWTLIVITIVSFCIILGIFNYLQCEVFYFFYPDAEVEFYRNPSSLLTIYAYFMCGSPANLRLGHLFTGKALFVIFSFSAIIITNAFLGCMTMLLSKRVLYQEIDSLKALKESELLIQIFLNDVKSGKEMFCQQNQSEALSAKLVGTLYDYSLEEFKELALNEFSFFDGLESFADYNFTKNRIDEVKKNILSMAVMDAVMISVPFSSNRKENIRINHLFQIEVEYHLMQECLITYPAMIPFPKNSFIYDKMNRIIYQNLETGHTKKMSEGFNTVMEFPLEGMDTKGAEPRPYDLNDLQSAFIGLIIGLFVSFVTFAGELITDLYPNSIIIKNLKTLKVFHL